MNHKKTLISIGCLLLPLFGTSVVLAQEAPEFINVSTAQELQEAVKSKHSDDGTTSYAQIRLMDDIYLSDISGSTIYHTFSGIIDGNSHTIFGGHDNQLDGGGHTLCSYLFNNVIDATLQNLTFKNIRCESEKDTHLGAIAKSFNYSTLKDVVMDNVSIWSNTQYAGTIAGSAKESHFENVQILGCDVTVDSEIAGGMIGYSNKGQYINCSTDEHSSVFSDGNDDSHYWESVCGGLVGEADVAKFTHCINRAIVGGDYQQIGGIIGQANSCTLTNCINVGMVLSIDESDFRTVSTKYKEGKFPSNTYRYGDEEHSAQYLPADELKLVDSDGAIGGMAGYDIASHVIGCVNFAPFYGTSTSFTGLDGLGGIIGYSSRSEIESCANYGFNAKEGAKYMGGIVGESKGSIINNCLNAAASAYGDEASNGSIVGKVGEETKVTNCLSTVAHRIVGDDWSFIGIATETFIDPNSGNNYRLEADNKSNEWDAQVSSAMLASGLVTRWLNNGKQNHDRGVKPWRQNLSSYGDKTQDNSPVLDPTHDEVKLTDLNMTLITSADELNAFAQRVNAGDQFACAALDADIDMQDIENFTPIGLNESYAQFRGIFDGRGHTIKNLKVHRNKEAGLFGGVHAHAEIWNVIVGEGSTIVSNGDEGAGGIVGRVCPNGWRWGNVVIENCGSYADVEANKNGGGIVGRVLVDYDNIYVYINNCYNMGSITASQGYSALLCGYTRNSAVVSNCWSGGKLLTSTSAQPFDKGKETKFFVGYLDQIDIKDCYAIDPAANVQGTDGSDLSQKGVSNLTSDVLTNGQFTYLLNGETNDVTNGLVWQQNLGTETHPMLGERGLYHQRHLTMKDYGTVCVPFALQSDDRIEYYLFKGVETEDDVIKLCFEYTDQVEPATPVLYHVWLNGTFDFVGPATEDCDFQPKSTPTSDWMLTGTFEEKVFEGDEAKTIFYISNDGHGKASIKNAKKVTIAPARAFFVGPSIETLNPEAGTSQARFSIVIDGEESTALQLVADDCVSAQTGRSYTLFGTEASEDYQGIVIRNGKKVINN